MNMEEFNKVLFDKCLAASEVLFSEMLTEVIEKEKLSPETIQIIKEDNAKRLYNLSTDSKWLWGQTDELISSFELDSDPEGLQSMLGFFQTIF